MFSSGRIPAFLRIGHAGAGGLAPPNTLRSLALALELGVDMVEFDVRACRDGLVLLHDDLLPHPGRDGSLKAGRCSLAELKTLKLADGETIPSLPEALDLIKGRALINLDLKERGIEAAVVDVLRRKRIENDVLVSSLYPDSLRRIRQLAPTMATGISYPEDRHRLSDRPALKPVVRAAIHTTRWLLPWRLSGILDRAKADAAMLYYEVASRRVVDRAHALGAGVFVWTVDRIDAMLKLQAVGVDGIASNRPDLFDRLPEKSGACTPG